MLRLVSIIFLYVHFTVFTL